MDVSMRYVNTAGDEVVFGNGSVFFSGTDVHDYAWDYDELNGSVRRFKRGLREFSVVLSMRGGSLAERSRVTDIFERDIAARKPGRLWCGGYWMECWVTGSSKANWHYCDGMMDAELTVLSEDPVWVGTHPFDFPKPDIGTYEHLDYPFGYPYDYMPMGTPDKLESPYGTPSGIRLIVYGPAVNPYVYIDGNRYQVNVSVESGGMLVVDSKEKSARLLDQYGNEQNVLHKRQRGREGGGTYLFEKVPPGESPVSWNGSFGWGGYLYDERSEPPWI